MHIRKLCIVFLVAINLVNSARILAIINVPIYSHFQLGERVYRELSERGHEVIFITPFKVNTPNKNLKPIFLTGYLEDYQAIRERIFLHRGISTNIFKVTVQLQKFGNCITELFFKHQSVQELLKSNQKFDLVIHEYFLNEAFSVFAHHYKAPSVILHAMALNRWINSKVGAAIYPAYMPDIHFAYSTKMDLYQRFWNTLVYVWTILWSHFYGFPEQNEILHKYFPGAPHLDDLMYNTSLMLLNSHPVIGEAYSLPPNAIEVGGYHIREPELLSKDLQEYLDNASDGVVLLSMGSNVKSIDLPEVKRRAITKSISKLKQKVLWKWEGDVLQGQPSNVRITKWFPQKDILAHPNIKLFIMQGGIFSIIEAVYHGVPVLGIPLLGDQAHNIAIAQNAGYAIGVPLTELTETVLDTALNKLLNDSSYATDAKQRAILLRDQHTKPLDRAIFWIEFVIRNQGAVHLRSPSLNLKWYQNLLLDVFAIILLGGITASVTIFVIVKKIINAKRINIIIKNSKKQA